MTPAGILQVRTKTGLLQRITKAWDADSAVSIRLLEAAVFR